MERVPEILSCSRVSVHKRRDFLSLSCVAATTFLLSREARASTLTYQSDDAMISNEVSAVDSLALYMNLLDEVRRLVLQRDARMIYLAKVGATDWLHDITERAEDLRSGFGVNSTPTPNQIRSFLSDVVSGGRRIFLALVEMRQQPLHEIERLDREFDNIRVELTSAIDSVKAGKPEAAKGKIASAVANLERYDTPDIERVSRALESEYQTRLTTPSRLQQLLETVNGSLGEGRAPRIRNFNHASMERSYSSIMPTALQSGITAVLRTRLNPGTWLQRAIGYAVTFPILLRVSDKNNRIKLLNDALRLVPPGLRNPLLSELATDLANLN